MITFTPLNNAPAPTQAAIQPVAATPAAPPTIIIQQPQPTPTESPRIATRTMEPPRSTDASEPVEQPAQSAPQLTPAPQPDGAEPDVPAEIDHPAPARITTTPPQPAPEAAPRPTPSDPYATLINVNLATAKELEALPRIGPVLAQRIVDHRNANGPFRSVRDMTAVKGIGEKTADGLAPYIRFQ
ncbi:MAG: hypothetical protein CMJ31_08730 [Phycisphaerae bacterium]|nr:hypothetical protein [Phycisphaerae bacterium]